MTREEAIKELETIKMCEVDTVREVQALDVALVALRLVSRERVEKVWHGCPYCKEGIYSEFAYDKMCRSQDGIYCKFCGKPMTDEAVDMMMERLEALYEQ